MQAQAGGWMQGQGEAMDRFEAKQPQPAPSSRPAAPASKLPPGCARQQGSAPVVQVGAPQAGAAGVPRQNAAPPTLHLPFLAHRLGLGCRKRGPRALTKCAAP